MEEFTVIDDKYLPEVAELYRSAFKGEPWNDDWSDTEQLYEYIRDVSGARNALNYGLFIDDKLVAVSLGGLRHWWEGTNYNIDELCVSPALQGQGIGSKFMKMIEEDLKKREIPGIFLQTDSDKPSYKFYMKNGYNELTKHVSFFKKV